MLRALIACEYSGIVREEFKRVGFHAVSCDLLPTEIPGPHYQGDVREILWDEWDIMIAHPPCTYLARSGLHWNRKDESRNQKTEEALGFVKMLLDAPIKYIALENPVGCIATRIRKPDQYTQPYLFGVNESKQTCFWLKNLPLLIPTDILPLPDNGVWANRTPSGNDKLGPQIKDRAKIRSMTCVNIARAMADQWGTFVIEEKARARSEG